MKIDRAGGPRVMTGPQAAAFATSARSSGKQVVFTNGVFDLLHPGHVRYLGEARRLGDLLIVGLNADDSVRRNKGQGIFTRNGTHKTNATKQPMKKQLPAIVSSVLSVLMFSTSAFAQLPSPCYGWNLGNTLDAPDGEGTCGHGSGARRGIVRPPRREPARARLRAIQAAVIRRTTGHAEV